MARVYLYWKLDFSIVILVYEMVLSIVGLGVVHTWIPPQNHKINLLHVSLFFPLLWLQHILVHLPNCCYPCCLTSVKSSAHGILDYPVLYTTDIVKEFQSFRLSVCPLAHQDLLVYVTGRLWRLYHHLLHVCNMSIYLEPKQTLFWSKRALFWSVEAPK